MTPDEFLKIGNDIVREQVEKAHIQTRNATLGAIKTIIRRTRMNETTKNHLLHQIELLRAKK